MKGYSRDKLEKMLSIELGLNDKLWLALVLSILL